MNELSIFEILGPIMIGPSSSHTAGAAKLAKIAKSIAGKYIMKVTFKLHGSFAETYQGHGTDRALLAGILGLSASDSRIRDAFELAERSNLEYHFEKADLGFVHPNTVLFELTLVDGSQVSIMGASIGGGAIEVTRINNVEVMVRGENPTLIIKHIDRPGMIEMIAKNIAVNIATMQVKRNKRGELATTVLELDQLPTKEMIKHIKSLEDVEQVILVKKSV